MLVPRRRASAREGSDQCQGTEPEGPARARGGPRCRVAAVTEVLERICIETSRALSASGAGVSVITDGGVQGMSVSSGPDAAAIEELQFTFGEGPCIDAFSTGRPVLITDLGE